MSSESPESVQEIRLLLRERFLVATANLNGKPCSFDMLNGVVVKGTFKGADREFHDVLVDNVDIKSSKSKAVILRSSDIVSINFPGLN